MLVGNLLNHHHARQANGTRGSDGCLICTDTNPNCECSFGQQCILIGRGCNQCPYAECIAAGSSTGSSKGGVSKGAVAGAVVAIILVLAATVAGFFWYRRRQRLAAQKNQDESKPDVPARAEDVLNRPDPNEKPPISPPPQLNSVRIYSATLQGTINLDPSASSTVGHTQPSNSSVHSNPFEDSHSIQTTSTGTQSNVIPIALVPPGSVRSGGSSIQSHGRNAAQAGANVRGDMNLDHVNVSNDTLPPPHAAYATSARSDTANNRMSYMTTGSYTSDFLETSVIVTPTRGTVKQVVGVAKAEVLHASPTDTLSRSSTLTRQHRSPLGASSFGPADVMQEDKEQEVTVPANPFSDHHSPYPTGSPAPSSTTFGSPGTSDAIPSRVTSRQEAAASWLQEDPALLYANNGNADERPASVYTQASAIVADISNARRVHLGFEQATQLPHTPLSAALSSPRTPYRMTSAKLVSPLMNHSAALQTGGSSTAGALEQQQARALKDLKRTSMSSMMTTATGADSILESFPFVPPSPISNLPPRSPPRSPLAQQSFAGSQEDPNSQSATQMVNRARASASASSTLSALQPPNRKVLGMSVASNGSTASNGLGSFPFQIDSGAAPQESNASTAPSSFTASSDGSGAQRKRASLDTLALTSDLSSYPLGFDKAPVPPVPRR
uniref:Opy2p n=1 Tax=Ganoderma boninense TaxID=34458 RepID=A0A5K1JRH3_9APHY|nr:Opy2p [Ganoderma boninense]